MQNKQRPKIMFNFLVCLLMGNIFAAAEAKKEVKFQVRDLLLKFEIRGNDINELLELPAGAFRLTARGHGGSEARPGILHHLPLRLALALRQAAAVGLQDRGALGQNAQPLPHIFGRGVGEGY